MTPEEQREYIELRSTFINMYPGRSLLDFENLDKEDLALVYLYMYKARKAKAKDDADKLKAEIEAPIDFGEWEKVTYNWVDGQVNKFLRWING